MAKKPAKADPLADFLSMASPEGLRDLVLRISAHRPDVRRECFDFLKTRVPASKELRERSEGEIALALWSELDYDLEELDSYGGGDHATEDRVAELLYQVRTQLDSKKVGSEHRREILRRVLPYIKSENSGMVDMLYEVAYAACYDDADLRSLAEAFEAMGGDSQLTQARQIYRRIGDHEKYLDLREKSLVYGDDYLELAEYYRKHGDKEKALQVAENGLRKGQGRMDGLRLFLAERAKKSGDRSRYLALQFEQTVDGLTLKNYKDFKKICTASEWEAFEPKVLGKLNGTWGTEQLKILMHRKEYDKAVALLVRRQYPQFSWHETDELRVAKKLEKHYPEEVLTYYLSGLGNLKSKAPRKEYARKARVMVKIRHLMIEVMGDEARWRTFACGISKDNIKRPALQQEFAAALPDWQGLG